MLLKISAVAEELGIAVSTLRYYEKIGLIKPQARVANSRRFDENAMLRLRLIKMAKSAGFTIAEIKQLMSAFSDETAPIAGTCQAFALSKQKELQLKIADLQKMISVLKPMLSCQCLSLKSCLQHSSNYGDQDYP